MQVEISRPEALSQASGFSQLTWRKKQGDFSKGKFEINNNLTSLYVILFVSYGMLSWLADFMLLNFKAACQGPLLTCP